MTPETLTPITVPDVLLVLSLMGLLLVLLVTDSNRLDREQAKTDAALKREHRGRP